MTIRFNYNIRLARVKTWFTIMHDWLKIHPGANLHFTIHEKLGFHQLELPHRAGLGVELEDNQHQFACLLNLG